MRKPKITVRHLRPPVDHDTLLAEALELLKSLGFDLQSWLKNVSFRGWSPQVPTARISFDGTGWHIEIGTAFVARHACDAERLAGVLLHEIMHQAIHLHKGKHLEALAGNFAADALINAMIHKLDAHLSKVFKGIYPENKGPFCLLRPDIKSKDPRLNALHQALYGVASLKQQSFYEVFDYALQWLKTLSQQALADLRQRLACAHDAHDPDALRKLRSAIPGYATDLERLQTQLAKAQDSQIEELLRQVAFETAAGMVIKQFASSAPQKSVIMPMPLCRRDSVMLEEVDESVGYRYSRVRPGRCSSRARRNMCRRAPMSISMSAVRCRSTSPGCTASSTA